MAKKVLLIADDDSMNRLIIKKFLGGIYDVLEAEDGQATLDVLKTSHVDLVLLDILMPEIDGLEVLSIMKSSPAMQSIGVLVATSTKEKTEREALSRGADDIVAKPYDPVVIKKRLENILAVKSVEERNRSLQSADTDGYVQQFKDDMTRECEQYLSKIVRFTDVIRANKSNFKLVDEVLEDINQQVEHIRVVTQK